jgi:DNA repair protein RadA/Sms
MAKNQTIYICSKCDSQTPKWQGRCPDCGGWGTLQEGSQPKEGKNKISGKASKLTNLNKIEGGDVKRIKTNIEEFDRVLGGGIVPGSLTLIGGEPGIGKSTLVLQISGLVKKTLYVSGEESAQQIKLRLDRLKINGDNILFSSDIEVENISQTIKEENLGLVIIDSIQTIRSSEIESETGSISQIRATTVKLLEVAKKHNTPIFIIGHITKDGQVAGPKTLEHLVDTVTYLEGDEKNDFRILKTKKNRFGPTSEIGVFEMDSGGLKEVKNPSGVFLDEGDKTNPGTTISSIIEGTRSFLIEVQALVSKTIFGYPQRRAFGFDTNRLQILSAVLTKRAGINLINQDINLNIVGGIKIKEPAVDLAVCLAVVSAYKNKALPKNLIAIGEVGLGGEIRKISKIDQRIKEAKILGFDKIITPSFSLKNNIDGIEIIQTKTLKEAIEKVF